MTKKPIKKMAKPFFNLPVWQAVIPLAAAVLLLGCSSQKGAPKFPVKGRVLVNGEPAGGMYIRFHALQSDLVGQDAQPVAISDEDGGFELSSFSAGDGAAAATYQVSFFWPVTPMVPSEDRLQGMFSNPKQSGFKVTVDAESIDLEPFELEIDKEEILPAMEMPLPTN